MLSTTSVASRLTLVSSITTEGGAEGDTLDTLNVNNMVDGALVYVANIGKFYQLRKNLPVTVVAANPNVIAGAGSSAELGFFVAVTQAAEGVLSGSGTVLIHGFSLSANVALAAVYVTPGGTQGFLRAARTDDHSVTVTSSSSSDTSTVLVFTVPALGVV
jgi:hypothetical protein